MGRLVFQVSDPPSFGAAIKDFRAAKSVSQAELAEAVGLHRSYLSGVEQGQVTEQVARLLNIFNHLQVKMVLVMEEDADSP
ncbi:MAG: helix-turn-helix domain-containing protein [Acidimicrobiales bacterium]